MDSIAWLFPIIFWLSLTYLLANKSLLRIRSEKLRLPPGPPKLPVIGNLHQLAAKDTPPHRRLRDLARVHGPIMHLRLGEIPTLVISSAEISKELLKTHEINFVNRPKLLVGKILHYNFSDIGLAPYGEYWRQLRKIATLELFSVKRVQSFRFIREEEVSKLIKSLALEAGNGSVVNLSDKLFSLLFNITSRTVLNQQGEVQDSFREFQTNLVDVLAGFSIADLYPSIKWLDLITGLRRKLEKMVKEADTLLDPVIDDHIAKKKQGSAEEDLVDVLLNFQRDSDLGHNEQSFSLTTNNIKAVILEIFSAGIEASFTTIEWAMSELLRNPEVMKKAQSEVREVFQEKGIIGESILSELKYLKLVIKETLRLHPASPLLIPRESIEHCQIHGYDTTPGTRVIVNAWAIGTDPKYWTDPEKFNPKRFDRSSIDYKGTNFEFIPFGAGRRMCPGIALAMANLELPLAMLLYHFDWKLPNGTKPEELNMDEVFGLSVRRKSKLNVIPIPYTESMALFGN